jgi:HlyD family secretion protein
MTRQRRKLIFLITVGIMVIVGIIYGFLPKPKPVQIAAVVHGPLQVIIEEEGETQVEQLYVISSPVSAFLRRIDFEPGDIVEKGQPLIYLEAPRATILDIRTRTEAMTRVEAAKARLVEAREHARAMEVIAEFSKSELRRIENLFESGSVSNQRLEQAASEAEQAAANFDSARAVVNAAQADLATAQAVLENVSFDETTQPVREILRSPESGRILNIYRKSEGHVSPGELLIEIGNIDRLEVRVDLLSQDAVRVRPGNRVMLEQWGQDLSVEAVVDRIEPLGFTVVSALGVEEQRVNVIANFVSPPEMWADLGSGYRVLAKFVIWEDENVLQVPTAALFRTEDKWAVFAIENNRAVQRLVQVGHRSNLATQVVGGLAEGDLVIVHPDSSIDEGVRVKARSDSQ